MNLYRVRLELDNLLGRQEVGISISMVEMGRSMQNGNAEHRLRAVKDEQVDSTEFWFIKMWYPQLGRFLDEIYIDKRIKSAPVYLALIQGVAGNCQTYSLAILIFVYRFWARLVPQISIEKHYRASVK